MTSLRTLTDDMDYYHKAFDLFHRYADRHNVLCRWIDTQLQQVVKGMDVSVTSKDKFKVLSIGPGDGAVESRIMKILHNRKEPRDRLHSTVVEPVADTVNKYKERVSAVESELKDITFDWKTQTLEEYLKMTDSAEDKFHFISAVHSIYYVPDLQASLKDLYNRLEPGGIMMIVVVSDMSGMGQIWRNFPILQSVRKHYPTSAQIHEACRSQSIPVSDEFTIKVRANITACFSDPKDMTEDGRHLLDFLTHVLHFTRDAPPELLQEVREFLGSDLCSEKGDEGEVHYIGDWKAFIIRH